MSVAEIISTYWSLSLTAFGGPNAHISMFYQLFVEKLNWLSAKKFAELFSISQTLPGPSSTQVGYAIALLHSGFTGAFVQLLLWTLPGTFIMIGFAYGIRHLDNHLPLILVEILNGLTSAAMGLVALSAFKMGNTIMTGKIQMSIATFVSVMAICFSFAWLLPSLMVFGGLITVGEYYLEQRVNRQEHSPLHATEGTQLEVSNQIEDDEEVDSQEKIFHNHKVGFVFLSIFIVLLIVALVIRSSNAPNILKIWSVMYFVGSIIFGGGTVVIPVLQQFVVGEGWLSDQEFLVGLALINTMPGIYTLIGPNFNIGVFCGALAIRNKPELLWLGGLVGNLGIFMPGIILISAIIPFWTKYRKNGLVKTILKGVCASAVGLVFAAIYLLGVKSVVPFESNSSTNIASYPFYTSIAVTAFASVGYLNLPAPFSILAGGLLGLLSWLI